MLKFIQQVKNTLMTTPENQWYLQKEFFVFEGTEKVDVPEDTSSKAYMIRKVQYMSENII